MKTLYELLAEKGIQPVDLAKDIDVDKATISRWNAKKIPADRVLDVERATGISRHELRPDLSKIFVETANAAADSEAAA